MHFVGLNTVMLQMEKDGIFVNKESLLRVLEKSWLGWSYSLFKGSAQLVWTSLWKNNSADERKEYIVLETVEVSIYCSCCYDQCWRC